MDKPNPPQIFGIRFEKTLTVGNLLAVFTMMSGILGSYYNIKYSILEDEKDRIALRTELHDFKSDVLAVRKPALDAISNNSKMNDIQNNRIENLADGLKQIRDSFHDISVSIMELSKQQAQAHEDISILKERQK